VLFEYSQTLGDITVGRFMDGEVNVQVSLFECIIWLFVRPAFF